MVLLTAALSDVSAVLACRWVDPEVCKQYGIAASEEEAASQSRKKGANVYNGAAHL